MLYAINNNQKTKAVPEAEGQCPFCDGEMIPKCGDIKYVPKREYVDVDDDGNQLKGE